MAKEDDVQPTVDVGLSVYDEDGTELGTVRGITKDGFEVTTLEGIEALSVEHERSIQDFGEAELMWRCASCGEMGDIEDLPGACPNCGAATEQVYYYIED